MRVSERKISWSIFGLAVLIQGAVGWVIYTNSHALIRQDALVQETLATRVELFNIFTHILDAESSTRGYLITGVPEHLAPYHKSRQDLEYQLSILREQARDNPLQKDLLNRLDPEIQKKMDWLERQIETSQKKGFQEARKMSLTLTGVELMGDVRITLRSMIESEQKNLENLREKADDASRLMLRWITVGGAISLSLMIVVFVVLRIENEKRRAAQREVAEARDAALQSVRMKSDFLANMSHEIRTPMNAMIGMTDLLAESSLTQEQLEYVHVIRQSGDNLLTIIDDILDLSKIEAGKLRLESVDFDLRTRTETVVDLLAERASAKGLELACVVRTDLPDMVSGDPVRIGQILTNLVSNAIKFTQQGEVVVEVLLEGRDTNRKLQFEVRDSGIGLTREAQERLFRPFMQADGSTTRKFGGTGLGLAISKQLVEMMGGEIGLESEENRGSRFWFKIPLILSRQIQKPSTNLSMSDHPTVIVFATKTSTRQVLHTYLQSLNVTPIYSAKNEPQMALQTPPMAILIEKGDSLLEDAELCTKLHNRPGWENSPVVYLTSLRDRPATAELRSMGMTLSLTKPVKLGSLAMTLRGLEMMNWTTSGSENIAQQTSQANPLDTSERPSQEEGKPKVLLVEDNEINQTVAYARLEKYGFATDLAQNGKEAVQKYQEGHYDLILMDCQMPDMDGYQATKVIRSLENGLRHIPIVALTAHAIAGDREKCLAAGMDDYLAKPFKPVDLQHLLEKWLGDKFPKASTPAVRVPTPETSSDEKILPLDLNVVKEVTNHEPDRIKRLLSVYLTNGRASLEKISAAIQQREILLVASTAHGFGGSSASFGAGRLAHWLKELELSAKQQDWDRLLQVWKEIEPEMARVENYLKEEFGELG